MCGILALINTWDGQVDKVRYHLSLLNHRGPDSSGITHWQFMGKSNYLGHTRLAIVDPESGAQPFETETGTLLAVNGEIYNWGQLKSLYKTEHRTKSDCECIAHLNDNYDDADCRWCEQICCMINGVYAFVCMNGKTKKIWAARDPLGVVPLYYGYKRDGTMAFASEMKALNGLVDVISEFPPGHYYVNGEGFNKFYHPSWEITHSLSLHPTYPERIQKGRKSGIRSTLEKAVKRRTMADVPWGVLLSGGLDSSIVAALASKIQHEWDYMPPINTFAIGLEGSPDLEAAELVAKHIGTNHRSYMFTVKEALNAIPDVIRHLETYDVTTIRAGVPMYLLARKIKATGVKMVLSGEGADEIYGGYLYFHNAPNWEEFFQETQRKIFDLHYYDCLRANKAMAAWGVECRVPFLDMDHIEHAMKLAPIIKMPTDERMEKHILRETFSDLLPTEICWRQKEQFSDGVGYKWIDSIKEMAKDSIHRKVWKQRSRMFPMHTPKTYEAMYYRMYYEKYFPIPAAYSLVPYGKSCACSSDTAARWKGNEKDDASGRSVKNHIKSVVNKLNG